jgi:hypothetical protein
MYLYFIASDTAQQYTGFTALWSRNDQCPNSCSGKGYCIQNSCYCNAGFSGIDCSSNAIIGTLTQGVVIKDTVNDFTWKFYKYDIPSCEPGQTFFIETKRVHNETPTNTFSSKWKWGGGYVTFYLNKDSIPDFWHWIDREFYYDINPHFQIIPASCPATYYIGIYADEAAVFSILPEKVATSSNLISTTISPSSESSDHTPAKHLGNGLIAAIVVIAISIIGFGALGGLYIYYTKFRKVNNHHFETVPTDDPLDEEQ